MIIITYPIFARLLLLVDAECPGLTGVPPIAISLFKIWLEYFLTLNFNSSSLSCESSREFKPLLIEPSSLLNNLLLDFNRITQNGYLKTYRSIYSSILFRLVIELFNSISIIRSSDAILSHGERVSKDGDLLSRGDEVPF